MSEDHSKLLCQRRRLLHQALHSTLGWKTLTLFSTINSFSLTNSANAASPVATTASSPANSVVLPPNFWNLVYEAPNKTTLKMADYRQHPLLLNFWASWCGPCIQEMPLLNEFQKNYAQQGWRVIGLAVDRLPAVQSYLSQHPVQFNIGITGMSGAELAQNLGNTHGALPYTVVIGADGQLKARKLGACTEADLNKWAKEYA